MGSQTDGLVPMLPPSQRHLQQQLLGLETPELDMYSLCIDCIYILFCSGIVDMLHLDSLEVYWGLPGICISFCLMWRRSWQTPDLR